MKVLLVGRAFAECVEGGKLGGIGLMRKAQVETEVQSIFQPGVNISTRVGGPWSDHQSCSLCRQCCRWLIPYVSKGLVGAGFVPELRQRDFPKRVICPRTHPSETAGVCEWGGVVCAGIPISTTDTMRKTEDRAVPRKEMSSLSLQRLCGSLSVACPCLGVSGVCAHWHPPCSTVPSGTCTQPLLKAQVLVKNFYSFKEDPHWLS